MINAKLFCAKGNWRYGLSLPWTLPDGRLAATDTRILIVFDASLYDGEKDADGRKPTLDPILSQHEDVKNWIAAPKLPQCDMCKGSGIVAEQLCDDCGGSGEVECDMGHDHDCDECGGSGKLVDEACPECWEQHASICGRSVAMNCARLVVNLPECEFGVDGKHANDGLCFRFTGGIGVVMPLDSNKLKKPTEATR